MAQFAPIADQFSKSFSSMYEQYDGVAHVSEYEFHTFFETNPNASAVIQGFVTIMHRDFTGEPAIAYSMMFKIVDALKLKMFLFAFGEDMEYLQSVGDDQAGVDELWEKAKGLFGEFQGSKRQTVSVAVEGWEEQVKESKAKGKGGAAPEASANAAEEAKTDVILGEGA